jgi:hypothetical protein
VEVLTVTKDLLVQALDINIVLQIALISAVLDDIAV